MNNSKQQTANQEKQAITKKWWFWAIVAFLVIGAIGTITGAGEDPNANETAEESTEETGTEEETSEESTQEAGLTESDARLYCQDANLISKFIDLSNVSIYRIMDQNEQIGKFGWIDADGNDVWYVRWNGKNKATDASIHFDCWVSGADKDNVKLHRFEIAGTRYIDSVSSTVFESDGKPVIISE